MLVNIRCTYMIFLINSFVLGVFSYWQDMRFTLGRFKSSLISIRSNNLATVNGYNLLRYLTWSNILIIKHWLLLCACIDSEHFLLHLQILQIRDKRRIRTLWKFIDNVQGPMWLFVHYELVLSLERHCVAWFLQNYT